VLLSGLLLDLYIDALSSLSGKINDLFSGDCVLSVLWRSLT
jgi:hypothetical protein